MKSWHRHRRLIISIAVLILLIIVLLPQTDALLRSMDSLRQASLSLVVLAIFMTVMTYILSGEIYHILAKHPVKLRELQLVQAATALTSRVAPIGIGTMGLNAFFLRRRNHSLSEALAVVATNNGLGIAGHVVLLLLVSLSAPLPEGVRFSFSWVAFYWILAVCSATLILITFHDRLRRNVVLAGSNLAKAIADYHRQPQQLGTALALSASLSCVYVLALMACAQALGIILPFNQIFIIYSFSLLTGVATPTPGGLVGVEAGLVAGFVTYGVAADTALAIALLYRLVTYWLPLIPGYIAFRVMQHKYL